MSKKMTITELKQYVASKARKLMNESFESEEFIPNGTYTVSNSGGYEIMISDDGGMAKVRDAFGSDNPKTSDWLPIEYFPTPYYDEESGDEFEPIIDPKGYNIPLNQVMRKQSSEDSGNYKPGEAFPPHNGLAEGKKSVRKITASINEDTNFLRATLHTLVGNEMKLGKRADMYGGVGHHVEEHKKAEQELEMFLLKNPSMLEFVEEVEAYFMNRLRENKMTATQLKQYVIAEANKLMQEELLKESMLDELSPDLKHRAFHAAEKISRNTDSDSLEHKRRTNQSYKFHTQVNSNLQAEVMTIAKMLGDQYEGILEKGVDGSEMTPYVLLRIGTQIADSTMSTIRIVIFKNKHEYTSDRNTFIPENVQRRLEAFVKKIQAQELASADAVAPTKTMSINENENTIYRFRVKHDGGSFVVKTSGSTPEVAKKKVASAEGCPESAITLIK